MAFVNFLSQAKATIVSKERKVESTPVVTSASPEVTVTANAATLMPPALTRRFSLRSFNFTRKDQGVQSTALPPIPEQDKHEDPDKRAQSSALVVRSFIVGPASSNVVQTTPAIPKPDLSDIRSQLMDPKTANKVIAQLKELPASDDPLHAHKPGAKSPIHAVCLAFTDAEVDAVHFAKLMSTSGEPGIVASALPGVISASVNTVSALFKEMHIVDLINAPGLGLGEPGDGKGLLAGALPTAETVIEGVQQITPELMALGYATGKAVLPNHAGIYPPTDRMSVLTYWWGLELVLPSPSLVYLGNAQSITNAVMNFLSALALIDNGVREILPFIRYISQYVDFEFGSIKKQDKGKGVVCAATWIMPVALVPRPWDFPARPPTETAIKTTEHPDIPQDTAKVTPQDTTTVITKDTATVIPQDTATVIPQDTSKVIPKDTTVIPKDTTTVIPQETPKVIPPETPKVSDTTSPKPPAENPKKPQFSVAALLGGS